MKTAVQLLNEASRTSFMKPQCHKGKEIQLEIMEAGLDLEDDKYYCRLSANGYLDCTDWSGPYDSVEDAAAALLEMYFDN